jgi:putative ABC transport system permease protein
LSLEEAFGTAVENLRSHKLRSSLTMLGMIFGVAAVIGMLSIGAGAQEQALATIEEMGIRNVILRAEEFKDDELKEMRKRSLGLSLRDADAIAEAVPGVESIGPVALVEARRVFGPSGKAEPRVLGVSHAYANTSGLSIAEGRFFTESEEKSAAQVCVIGPRVRNELYGYGPALGRDVKVGDVWLTVIGTLRTRFEGEEKLQGIRIVSAANDVYLPVSTAIYKFPRPPLKQGLDEIVVTLKHGVDPQETAAVAGTLLQRLHGGVSDYSIVVPDALLAQSRRTQRIFDVVMGCIAGISLLVGGIGIMNIMLATVLERTREIGVRRAIGATRLDIRNQFIVESFTLSIAGGLSGVVVGVGLAKLVAAYAGWQTIVTISSVLLSTGVSISVGLIFGIYPALRAADLDPIEALRYE